MNRLSWSPETSKLQRCAFIWLPKDQEPGNWAGNEVHVRGLNVTSHSAGSALLAALRFRILQGEQPRSGPFACGLLHGSRIVSTIFFLLSARVSETRQHEGEILFLVAKSSKKL